MISHISIKDFAVIKNAEVDFYDGLNIITGETGAGKSVLIEAVSLALGSRADTTFIRTGQDKAIVQLACAKDGEDYVITRELSAAGKNLCKINGEMVTVAQLKDFCKDLVDVHGQYDHQSLLDPENHLRLIDAFGKKSIQPLKDSVAVSYEKYSEAKRSLDSLLAAEREDARQRDFMQYEHDEIQKAALTPGEDTALSERVNILQNSEKIYESLAGAYEALSGSSGESYNATDLVGGSLEPIRQISQYSEELSGIEKRLGETFYELQDLAEEIRTARDNIVFDPQELNDSLARLDLIDSLKTKYGSSIEEILAYDETLVEKLSFLEDSEEKKKELTEEVRKTEADLLERSEELSSLRKKTAEALSAKMREELAGLNFENAVLSIDFSRKNEYSIEGFDKVEFMISTNRGEELKPLAKIASGGEMSRIMLAFKKTAGENDSIPTMIFDEIDSGISGVTASIVGRNLLELSSDHQIICITHLPQIAAFGQTNYRISKSSDDSATYTSVDLLDEEEKVLEIARLTGGMSITEKTLENARELIEGAITK
ncbi:MAG: DNA repair protein RecN [Firmicutes bacterium]|nr:DNA repair protein RecN [Bacillota bacterium]